MVCHNRFHQMPGTSIQPCSNQAPSGTIHPVTMSLKSLSLTLHQVELLGMLDCAIDLTTRNGNARVFINSRYLKVIKSGAYQQDLYQLRPLINMAWLIVGKLWQGMRCCECNSNSNVFVCETQGKVCIRMGESVSE